MTLSDSAYIRRFFSLYSQEEKDKVRGHAFYPTDYLTAIIPADVAFVGVVRSPIPGAKFSNIDEKKLKEIPGVIRVITARDIPKNLPFGKRGADGQTKIKSQLILAENEVRYQGEPVALIVAETQDALQKAHRAISIDWKSEPLKEKEVVETIHHQMGKATKDSLEEIKAPFYFPNLQTRYLEAESGWVDYKNEKMQFHVGSLLSESQRVWLSEVLQVSHEKILAKESSLGGQFGGRQQRELIVFLALASHLTKRSVRLHFTQQEQDIGSYGYSGELALRFDPKSKLLKELRGEISVDAGSYAGNAQLILKKALEHAASLYEFDHIDLTGKVVLTPTHPRRALKGEGVTAITWVIEQLVEKVAKTLDVPALEFRISNCREDCDRAEDVLKEAEKLEKPFRLVPIDRNRPVWDEKAIVGRGFGFQVFQPTTLKEFDFSEITIEMQASGSFLIRTSNLTLDLHVKSALCEVAAAVLHTHPKAFTVEGKMRSPLDKPARRQTYPEFYYLAQATFSAASLLKDKLVAAGNHVFNSKSVILKDGAVLEQSTNKKMGYRELAFTESLGHLTASFLLKDVERPHGCSAGAVARVAFHPLTGEMRVESVKVVLDAGPVLYQKGLEIEVDTAVSWAMAALFSSEVTEEQPIPTPLDGPEETTLITLEYPLKDYPDHAPEYFGSRGITDVLMSVVLASLVNAIYDAKDVTLEEIPMSKEFMYPKRKTQTFHTLPFKRS
ncbi:MAG: xanthine dehydrogenase family protein molybdopterin-binding subunit [Deltaproteobacteria bacterium]|nr:xanthine dehydrogenase family protein molybdopterin-binding subunit [Deltaproteobacteria bacterium]